VCICASRLRASQREFGVKIAIEFNHDITTDLADPGR
jgi:hypothetical protein